MMFADTTAFSGSAGDVVDKARRFYGETLGPNVSDGPVEDLTSRGVEMQRFDGFEQDERGIMRDNGPTIAWLNDPAGNIIEQE